MRDKMRLTAIVLMSLALTGCFTTRVYVEGKRPTVTKPDRPVLETVTPPNRAFAEGADSQSEYLKLYKNMQKLLGFTMGLEDAVDTYNEQARAHNIKNGYSDVSE
jgi:hypothetical protein